MRQVALDVLGLGCLGVLFVGLHQVYPPAALIVGGLAGAVTAVLLSRRA